MVKAGTGRYRRSVAFALALVVVPMGALPCAGRARSGADVTAVRGRALGYHADEIVIFGGAQEDTGPTPDVRLEPDASNSPQTASAETGLVQYGPATLFTSDGVAVGTSGSLGATGSVTSSADIFNINKASSQPDDTGSEVFTADRVTSTCTTSEEVSGSTTITNGTLRTHAQAEDHDEGVVAIPANPPPNYSVEGHVHLGGSTQDNFRYVFNEQVMNPDGSITVTAAHQYLLGPIATGHLYVGRVTCGVTVGETTPARPDALIRVKGRGPWVGVDIFDTTGRQQTAATGARRAKRRVFAIKVENDGETKGSFVLDGSRKVRGFATRYRRSGRDITDDVAKGEYVLRGIAPGQSKVIELIVKVQRRASIGKIGSWLITSTSMLHSGVADAVRAKVRVKRR